LIFRIEVRKERRGVTRAVFLLNLACVLALPADHLKVGFGQDPPLHYRDARSRSAGFIVDVVNEAARREQIQITWEQVAGSQEIEPALQNGRIDIFPSAIITQVRQTRFWVSEPWWTEDLLVLARADLGNSPRRNWSGVRVLLPSDAYNAIADVSTPGAVFEVLPKQKSSEDQDLGATLLCAGKADAALMPHFTVDEILAKRPRNCLQTKFNTLETVNPLPLAVISRWDHKWLAERIRSQINEMALDGRLMSIAVRYPRAPAARSAIVLAETLRLRYNERLLWIAFACALLIAVLVTVLLSQQIRVKRQLRHTMAEQAETEQLLRTRTNELMLSNEELQAFAYSVSHDLQEPLRGIALYSEMLERHFRDATAEAKEMLNVVRRNSLRMQEMVQQLLLLSRMSRSEAKRITVDLEDVLSTVLQDLGVAITSSAAEIVIGSMPTVRGWPDRLSVVFQNLIGNALKYRRNNVPPHIEISALDQGAEWKISVRDNGIGFEQKYAESIFGVFKRLHVQDQYGGTGVGLAIVKSVIERHGGRIWVESKPDQGSTFYFTLPHTKGGNASMPEAEPEKRD
jgi:signal transduction histidine kinase